jgi:hypothetical protein
LESTPLAPEPGKSLECEEVFENEEHTLALKLVFELVFGRVFLAALELHRLSSVVSYGRQRWGSWELPVRVDDLQLVTETVPALIAREVDDPVAVECEADEHSDRVVSDRAPVVGRPSHGAFDAHHRAQRRSGCRSRCRS